MITNTAFYSKTYNRFENILICFSENSATYIYIMCTCTVYYATIFKN